MMNSIHEALYWRYATKKFDPTLKLTAEERATVLEAIRLAPTCYGLQPYRVIVVENPEVRAQLREVGYDQPQITDSDTLLVFCARTELTEADVQEYIDRMATTRGVDVASLDGFKAMMAGLPSMTPTEAESWSARQAYIGLGFGLEAAALSGIDACPMEGFDHAKFDEILGLKEKGLASKAVMTLGRRLPDDPYATYKKVRHSEEAMFLRV